MRSSTAQPDSADEKLGGALPMPSRRVVLGYLMALCFISHFNRASITSAGDERIMRQFAISPNEMGVIYSAFLLVYTVFMIPGGWFIDRKGPRVALAAMGIGSATFCAITGGVGLGFIAPAGVWVALLLVRSLMGLLSTPLHPGAARAVGNWFPAKERALANGLVTGASILAYAVVHPIFGRLIDQVDWPMAFIITGSATATLAICWLYTVRDHPAPANESEERVAAAKEVEQASGAATESGWALLKDRRLVLLTLSYSAVGYFQYLFFYWLHYYFDSVLQMDKADSRFYAGLPNLAMALCMPVGGWLADRARRLGGRGGRTLVPMVGMAASAVLLLVGIAAQDRMWIVLWFTLSLGVLGLCEATFWTIAVELGGKKGGTAAAIMNTGGNGIGLLAPMITPWVGAALGWNWGIGLGAAVGLLGAACWMGIRTNPDGTQAPGRN